FGDWDSSNNLMRAQLATATYSLSCAWAGRPHWYFHHMGMGETIGFSARACENADYGFLESPGLYKVHVALMGDPTLRMHPLVPPTELTAATNGQGGVELRWQAPPQAVAGYHVYRAPTAAGPVVRISPALVTETRFSDPVGPTNVYLVRAVKLEATPTGSYYNASQGIFQDVAGSFGPPRLTLTRMADGSLFSWPSNALVYLESSPLLGGP